MKANVKNILATKLWSSVSIENPQPNPRFSHSAIASENFMLIFGGNGNSAVTQNYNDTWVFQYSKQSSFFFINKKKKIPLLEI